MVSLSSYVSLVLISACLVSSSGARIRKDRLWSNRKDSLSDSKIECPDKVKINTKGDCVDLAGQTAPPECCNCDAKITEALHYYQDRSSFYVQKCEVQQTDVKPIDNGDFLLMDDTRICSETCQGFEELQEKRTLESWGLDHCTEESLYQQLVTMAGVILAMDTAWDNCEALFEPVAPHQNKIVFVIDVSTSMGIRSDFCEKDRTSGTEVCRRMTRLQVVQEKLPEAINALDEDQQFTIVAFGSRTTLFNEHVGWTKATSMNKQIAGGWVKALQVNGATYLLRALREVQAKYGDYDSITLLGDGEASDCRLKACLDFCPGGQCEKPVHTTLFMPGSSGSRYETAKHLLQLIAEETGGKFREPFPPAGR